MRQWEVVRLGRYSEGFAEHLDEERGGKRGSKKNTKGLGRVNREVGRMRLWGCS